MTEEFAVDYAEHLRTGKVWLEIIPDHLKWSFIATQQKVDLFLENTLGKQFDEGKRARVKSFIFRDTKSFEELVRKLWLAKLYFSECWSYLDGDDCKLFLVDDVIRDFSPVKGGWCPFCKNEVKQ